MIKTKLILASLVVFTAFTTVSTIGQVLAKANILKNFDGGRHALASESTSVQEIEVIAKESPSEESVEPTKVPTIKAIIQKVIPTLKPTAIIPTPTTKTFPSANVVVTPTTAPSNNSNRCIITISATQYDITDLLTSHSGGNIFKCGTDMTASYQGKHGTSLSRMQRYLVTSNGGPTSNPGSTTSPTTSPSRDDDDREDEEHEDKYYEIQKHQLEKQRELESEEDDD